MHNYKAINLQETDRSEKPDSSSTEIKDSWSPHRKIYLVENTALVIFITVNRDSRRNRRVAAGARQNVRQKGEPAEIETNWERSERTSERSEAGGGAQRRSFAATEPSNLSETSHVWFSAPGDWNSQKSCPRRLLPCSLFHCCIFSNATSSIRELTLGIFFAGNRIKKMLPMTQWRVSCKWKKVSYRDQEESNSYTNKI